MEEQYQPHVFPRVTEALRHQQAIITVGRYLGMQLLLS